MTRHGRLQLFVILVLVIGAAPEGRLVRPQTPPVAAPPQREMYFDAGNRRLFAVPVRTDPEFMVGGPAVALPIEGFVQTGIGRRMYDLLPDGRFLMIFP